MILRLILVGLVTSMGFELPSSRDVSSWVESSRAWASLQTNDRTASGLPVVATEVTTDYGSSDADQPFRVAQSETLADFHAAAEATVVDAPPLPDALASDSVPATVEVVEVVAAGLSDGEELAVASLLLDAPSVPAVTPASPAEATTQVASRAESAPAVGAVDAPVVVVEVNDAAVMVDSVDDLDAAPTRGERLANAIRLTREAAQAWASLIDEPAAAEATAVDTGDAR